MSLYKGQPLALKVAAGVLGLVAVGALAVATTSSGDSALADGADKSSFVDITKVKPNVKKPRPENGATTGTFTVDCGRNENGHFNPDNFIAQPGVLNGAQHLHDYVGNLSTDANSNNKSLEAAGTTCKNGDKSAYFWPVVRIDDDDEEAEAKVVSCPDVAGKLPAVPSQAKAEVDRNLALLKTQIDEANKRLAKNENPRDPNFNQNAIVGPLKDKRVATIDRIAIAIGRNAQRPQGLEQLAPCKLAGGEGGGENELPGNDGDIQRPEVAELTFRGSPVGKVVAMPKFLRVLYGDAKVSTNGTKNAKDSWTCTGFEDKVLINKYPVCPQGSKVKRIHDFPSCWDGKNIDSAKHREHILFPDANGRCQKGFKAVPQLRISLTYNIPRDIQQRGKYAVDSFPEEKHNPFSDHDDFANVMSQQIMNRLVNCVNTGKKCRE
ncbi:DUF1996 domain-containing protein [Lentzea sp. BCCO 10_0856]|uniref:DUF1996 domain-containing protein n=1 Tax=Lentzea miocenica TaxID=3095431 RepID=A0ABU4TBZ9_9PSEU|nr:DUF1996 domain-containing protein [Lentzea sp. BCCO 10_0856]MDX8035707.1 DUF1996 domain-containing protein [Lentzea sp. BCCO 10_0856]